MPARVHATTARISDSLRDHFLLAMPCLSEGIFSHSITYICEHGESGAMGIVINQPLDLSVGEIFEHLQIDSLRDFSEMPVMAGGPVQIDHGFVLHRGCEAAWEIKGGKKARLLKRPVYTGITPVFWGSCDKVCGPSEWKFWGLLNCGKGEPMQVMHVSHGTSPARFRGIKVGGAK